MSKLGRFVESIVAFSIVVSCITPNQAYAVSNNPTATCNASSICTVTFPFTGDYYAWSVPSGANSITFDVQGAQGGSTTSAGGLGGRVTGTLSTTPGSTLYIYVGGVGAANSAGGWNGGGDATGITHGASGGGGSDIRTIIGDWNSRIIVAGGGGGASGGSFPNVGGAGGGLTGGDGPISGSYVGGKGGTQSAGGAGGTGYCSPAVPGNFGTGGSSNVYHCPAGGGGWYGGGRGAVMGGGGGSSYSSPTLASGVAHTQGFRTGNGLIVLTYQSSLPVITTSIQGNASSVQKGQSIQITSNVDQAGRVTFLANGKRIPACIGISTLGGNVTCNWKPAVQGVFRITAAIYQNGVFKSSSLPLTVISQRRTGTR